MIMMLEMIRVARKSLVSAIPGSQFHFRNSVDWEQEPDGDGDDDNDDKNYDDDDEYDLADVDHNHDIDAVKNEVKSSSGVEMDLRPRVRSGKATAEKTWKWFNFVTHENAKMLVINCVVTMNMIVTKMPIMMMMTKMTMTPYPKEASMMKRR